MGIRVCRLHGVFDYSNEEGCPVCMDIKAEVEWEASIESEAE